MNNKKQLNDIHKTVKKIDNKINKILDYQTAEQYQREILQLTFNEWLDKWQDMFKQHLKPSTLYKYNCLRNRYIADTLGTVPLSNITALEIQRLLISIKAPRQAQHIYTLLKDSITKAYSLDLILSNPMKAITKPRHEKTKSKAFDREQQRRLEYAISKNKYATLFYIMLYAGLRKGEALALTYKDIDLENGYINVTKTVGHKNAIHSPKTKTSIRQVPILSNLIPHLKKYALNSPRRLFIINPSNINKKHYSRILQQSGLDKQGFTVHSLRHTFATRCIENNVPPKVLQRWLGHSTIDMTMNIYTHINNDFERSTIDKLNKLIQSKE